MSPSIDPIDHETRELTEQATGILSLFAADGSPLPPQNERAFTEAMALSSNWEKHLQSLSSASNVILSHDRHFASFLRQFEREAASVMHRLDQLKTVVPRSNRRADSESFGLKIREAAAAALRVIAREEETVLPLLRRWGPSTRNRP